VHTLKVLVILVTILALGFIGYRILGPIKIPKSPASSRHLLNPNRAESSSSSQEEKKSHPWLSEEFQRTVQLLAIRSLINPLRYARKPEEIIELIATKLRPYGKVAEDEISRQIEKSKGKFKDVLISLRERLR
jgi:hypothetical protein